MWVSLLFEVEDSYGLINYTYTGRYNAGLHDATRETITRLLTVHVRLWVPVAVAEVAGTLLRDRLIALG